MRPPENENERLGLFFAAGQSDQTVPRLHALAQECVYVGISRRKITAGTG